MGAVQVFDHWHQTFTVATYIHPTHVTWSHMKCVWALVLLPGCHLLLFTVPFLLSESSHPNCLLSVYVSTRSGATDKFKGALYVAPGCNSWPLYGLDNDLYILGYLNADLGTEGGPQACKPANEHSRLHLRPSQSPPHMGVRHMAPCPPLTTSLAHHTCSLLSQTV